MSKRLVQVEVGNHIVAVYPDKKTKLDEAFEFLRPALERNEIAMIITDDMTKDEIRERMTKEWNVKVAELEEKGDIVIKSVTEWHLLDGSLNAQRTVALWNMLAEQTIARKEWCSRGRRHGRLF